ncbi:tyrosine-type recombinase/integrase [Streptomyces sp. NY05-11A]|uniref:tyrosine-type recombinase/integrase n=1 Tax=Streptomyces soliscabiei TaxID=588897 RepID=UPI0029B08A18|nr:tyrosine-type recombinase/integrase [Streptomyces sp. NY05-11A]MDX2676330.1 tyrosine-type recombinase/integrase [Streptomyces sp. NY05-11A]
MADSTLRHRRIDHVPAQSGKRLKHDVGKLVAAPSTARSAPRPYGDLSEADVEDIADCAAVAWETVTHSSGRKTRRIATRRVLTYLAQFPGKTWQDRWVASGLDEPGNPLRERFDYGPHKTQAALGLRCLICLRVIQPSLRAVRSNDFVGLAEQFRHVQQDMRLDEFFAAESASAHSLGQQRTSLFDVTLALITQGIALEDLTPEGLLHYSLECHRYGLTRGASPGSSRFAGHSAWETLHGMGVFPAGTPQRLRAVLVSGQKSVTELVDSYPIRCGGVRQLFIDYLERRRTELDYSALTGLAQLLVSVFWQKIEEIAPEQADLSLSNDVYQKWREEVSFVGKERDQPRRTLDSLLLQVRGFYLDLQSWALEEPERWGVWAVPCPVPRHEVRSARSGRRRAKERTDNRIRERQPLLPTLVEHVEEKHRKSRALLEAAAAVPLGDEFTHAGRSCRRTNSRADQAKARHSKAPVRVEDLVTGEVIHAEGAEEDAFWDWAYVETLRLSGVRIEELVELTQLSIRQYQRPNGEVVALLVIAPSKTDRERVIPMSAELFHVIASVIRRHITGEQRSVPLLQRYDAHERQWSASMPFLFQRGSRGGRGVISPNTIANRIRTLCRELAESNPAFVGLTFAPHDFRRLFATEIVNNGLPIHIGAALLGHLNIETTGGYVAVFNEDVVRHYQEYLARRRAVRPVEEYRSATSDEWDEFQEHFDRRKVELGNCARPYGTPCQHEHACLRCPMLQVNPKMVSRLNELEDDLEARRKQAETEGWLGEIEGIDLTLQFLREKRKQALRSEQPGRSVDLGIPSFAPRP